MILSIFVETKKSHLIVWPKDLFALLEGRTSSSKLDLSHAYQQILLEEGLSRFEEEHLAHLAEVFKCLADVGMRLKREKFSFLLSSVEYLGHIMSTEGLKTSDSMVKAFSNAPLPANMSELRSFLGLVNYYEKFLPNLATTLAPLYVILQRSKRWSRQKAQEASCHVRERLKSNKELTHSNDSLPKVLSCDASPCGVGAVLNHCLPNFASRTLSIAEKKYSQLDKEALAIVLGVKRFYCYLFGRSFSPKTDYKPLMHIFNEK
uniref:Reverse transcriptase/retrotransposon-derived protein RNase H-like domain-containing protein n=1 Tax=Amphimedon queenslandica TaxID=400682 RepID=A0A1X7VWY5_AMPQE